MNNLLQSGDRSPFDEDRLLAESRLQELEKMKSEQQEILKELEKLKTSVSLMC